MSFWVTALRRRPKGRIPRIRSLQRSRARRIIENVMTQSTQRPLWMSAEDIADLLKCYGIRLVETLLAETPDEAANMAAKIGFPVAVKLASNTIVHKTDIGGVMLDLNSEDEVKRVCRAH
jgi:acyl-CoA synthetase (NDP forming)